MHTADEIRNLLDSAERAFDRVQTLRHRHALYVTGLFIVVAIAICIAGQLAMTVLSLDAAQSSIDHWNSNPAESLARTYLIGYCITFAALIIAAVLTSIVVFMPMSSLARSTRTPELRRAEASLIKLVAALDRARHSPVWTGEYNAVFEARYELTRKRLPNPVRKQSQHRVTSPRVRQA